MSDYSKGDCCHLSAAAGIKFSGRTEIVRSGRCRRLLVIPESQAERRLTPQKRLLADESGIVRQRGSRRACSPNAAPAVIGCVFIRGRPPSCVGDRVFSMGTKMGGIRHCFRILLE